MSELSDRLSDPNERFSPQEIYSLFEELAEQYGFYRDPSLPPKGSAIETSSLTVTGFEHYGVLVVRPRTIRDSSIAIPSTADKILGDNFKPSQATAFNANLIALAMAVIVAPVHTVESVLNSSDDQDMGFFLAFATEYGQWMQERGKAIAQKKSGRTSGNVPNI